MNLDFMSSPVRDRPGLLIRDPYGYSEASMIVPPPLVEALQLFDGSATDLDLRKALVEITGSLEVGELETHLIESLSNAGFLENEVYYQMRDERHREFAETKLRLPAHAGAAYPDDPEEMKLVFAENLEGEAAPAVDGLIGIAAPHASPDGAWDSYRAAYKSLPADYAERIFVVLGTSHYGEPDRFGLTRKNYVSPLGEARTELSIVDELEAAAPGAVLMEDFCHASEHSIEFQVAFLQYLYGPSVRVVPILCGSYARSIYQGGNPEENEDVKRFLGALGELGARREKEIAWVLGVDMAHVGRRYGDPFASTAYQGEMLTVSARDKDRIHAIEKGDARGFWEYVQQNQDDLKWCGSAPFYTFLKAVPEARARMLRYQHWQIDPQSVVSFAAVAFTK
jgi:AmmeMemoRadiSam system protein B